MNKKFSREEMYLIYEELKRRYKEISKETSTPYAGKYKVSNFGSLILFAYNMPDKQVLLTVTEEKRVTFTIKLGVDYVDAGSSLDIKGLPRETIKWGYFEFNSNSELLSMVNIMTSLI